MADRSGGSNPAPGFRRDPHYAMRIVASEKRVRVQLAGVTVADSTHTALLLEANRAPVYYFPRADVAAALLRPSTRVTHCPFKGDARYWHLAIGDRTVEDAVWSYETPFDEAAPVAGHMAFYWERVDRWLEEDEEIFVHPRDPFVRIDIRETSRPVRVEWEGRLIAETRRARGLFETGQPARWYIPPEDVHTEHLAGDEEARSACPYKGTARHFGVTVDGRTLPDAAWVYAMPTPEARRIVDYVCFDPEKVTVSVGDGAE
ncbi:MAG: DUF427 domain-containing protein [Alphaproteobacteria bacterium]